MARHRVKRRGFFITFEGTEGSGKTTQCRLLCRFLSRQGYRWLCTREPGGTKISNEIRKVLLQGREDKISPLSETLLYMASRAHLTQQIIRPALLNKKIVVCDRYIDSTRAYQGFGLGVSLDFIDRIASEVTQSLEPDLTLLLQGDVRQGLRRATRHRKADRIESRAFKFHKRVSKGYLSLAKRHAKRFRVIKADRPIGEVQQEIRRVVLHELQQHFRPRRGRS